MAEMEVLEHGKCSSAELFRIGVKLEGSVKFMAAFD